MAAAAGTQQSTVSELEAGRFANVKVHIVRAVFAALDAELTLVPLWRGAGLDRLLDERHAALVERIVALLHGAGWEAAVEVSYSRYGERGSIDVLGTKARSRAVLVIEVKSELASMEGTIRPMDAKTRLAPLVAAERLGWRPAIVGRVLVLPEGSTTRRRVAAHGSMLDAAFPARGVEIRRWMQEPVAALSGILFLPPIARGDPRRRIPGATRVRLGSRRPDDGGSSVGRSSSAGAQRTAAPPSPHCIATGDR